MFKKSAAVSSLALLGLVMVTGPSSAAGASVTLSVSPERIQLSASPGQSTADANLTVDVTTSIPAHVAATITDVVADEEGNWVPAPLGSTSYTLKPVLQMDPQSFAVSPSANIQHIPIRLAVPVSSMDRPRVGIVSVTLIPGSSSSDKSTAVGQGLTIDTVVVAETAPQAVTGAADVKVSLAGSGLGVRTSRGFTFADSLVPDLPGLVDHGPVTAIAHYRNDGDFVVDAQTTFEYASVSPLSLLPASSDSGHVFYLLTQVHQYALPGQAAASSAVSQVPVKGAGPVDTLPFIGLVRVTATTTGSLGPLQAAPVVQSTVFLVFPWKEALVILLVIVGWITFRRRLRNRRQRVEPPSSPSPELVESVP